MFAAKRRMIVVFVFVVQCLTQHTDLYSYLGVWGVVCFMGLCWWF